MQSKEGPLNALKNVELFPGYERVREPDKEKLAELVLRAKRKKRSLSEFAEACGVNTASLLRIINRMNTGASADSIIAAIAMNADPQSSISLGNLFDTHGLAPKRHPVIEFDAATDTPSGDAPVEVEALESWTMRSSLRMPQAIRIAGCERHSTNARIANE